MRCEQTLAGCGQKSLEVVKVEFSFHSKEKKDWMIEKGIKLQMFSSNS